MNILIIHEIDWVEKITMEPYHFSELFSLEGHNVFVIDCPSSNFKKFFNGLVTRKEKYNRIYENASITLIHPPSILIKGLNRITSFFTVGKVIKKTIFENNIDAILLYGTATNGIQAIKESKKKKIILIYRALDLAHELISIPIIKWQAKKHEKFVITNANKVLTPTKRMKEYAVRMGGEKENVEYFPLGVNIKIFNPCSKDKKILSQLKINEEDKKIIFVGTLYNFSGLFEIIDKFEIIKEKIQSIKLIIVGDGEDRERLKKTCKK